MSDVILAGISGCPETLDFLGGHLYTGRLGGYHHWACSSQQATASRADHALVRLLSAHGIGVQQVPLSLASKQVAQASV